MLEELNQIHASEELIQETLQYCKDNKSSGRTINNTETNSARVKGITRKINRWAVAAAACVGIVVMSSGVAFAYNQVTGESIFKAIYKVINTASSANTSKGVTDDNGNSYVYDKNVVDNTKINKNLTVTMDSYVVNGNKAEIKFTVKTNDGSPLNEVTENKIPIMARDKFQDIKVSIDGDTINNSTMDFKKEPRSVDQMRVDDANDPSTATIMVYVSDPQKETLRGSTLSLEMGSYSSTYNNLESIGFKYDNVAEMFASETLADDSQFTGDNQYMYVDTDVELAPGNMHIVFSSKYPDTYIDNAGYTTRESRDRSKTFVMTIVPENDAVSQELLSLCFQNKTSGFPMALHINKLSDGRIQIEYAADSDRLYSKVNDGINTDTNETHLANLILKKSVANAPESETVYSSNDKFSFTCKLDNEEDTILTETDIKIRDTVYTGTTVNIKSVELTVTELKLNGLIFTDDTNDKRLSVSNNNSPLITMKNGTSFHAGSKCGSASNMYNDDWGAEWLLPTYITPSDVQSITWHGVTIYEAE